MFRDLRMVWVETLPDEIEFWLDGEGRIHERLNYKKKEGRWEKELLYP